MCGIAGFIANNGGPLPNSSLLKMTDLIYHRGPDDEGYFFYSTDKSIIIAAGESTPGPVWDARSDYRPTVYASSVGHHYSHLAFGHRRLSILDLSPGGHQPMTYGNGKLWIIFNGEIYNYKDLQNELKIYGHSFKTSSDTETILAAFAEWGVNCFEKFVGMWALAIFDAEREEIILSRDRYGIKPLYYYFSSSGDLYFGSEIKQFTAISEWKPRMNPGRVYDQLIYSFTDHTDETMFSGVWQLPAGSYFRSSIRKISRDTEGKVKVNQWYSAVHRPFKGTFEDAAAEFKSLFTRAVREHLNADVPVGTALSGGLDSSSIVCEVSRILGEEGSSELQKTFSSCSTYEQYSERKWMDLVIAHTNVEAYFVYPSVEQVMEITPSLVWFHDEPYQSQSAFLAYNLFQLARVNNVKVLLNGQGADEYLGGYGQFTIARYAGMLKKLRFSDLLSDIKKSSEINNHSTAGIISGVVFHLIPDFARRSLTRLRSTSDNVKSLIDLKKLNARPLHPFDQIPVPYRSVPEISDHLTFYSTLPKYLHWEDRNSMANSVEARVPFLDHRLVEFSSGLPDDFLEKDGVNKRVMRAALKGLIPEGTRNRKDKMGFTTPEEMWVRKENPGIFKRKLEEAVNVTNGIIKPEVLAYFDEVVSGRQKFDYTYWRLILFSEWIKKFEIKL